MAKRDANFLSKRKGHKKSFSAEKDFTLNFGPEYPATCAILKMIESRQFHGTNVLFYPSKSNSVKAVCTAAINGLRRLVNLLAHSLKVIYHF